MKLQLVLFTLLFMPLLIKGQTSTPESVVFYSKGKMHVKYRAGSGDDIDGSKSKSTTLYIKGSSEFADGSGIVQVGRTELTGDFVNAKSTSVSDTPNLFIQDNGTYAGSTTGVFAFIGVDNKQTIRSATSVASETQKSSRFIAFPTLRIEKWVTGTTYNSTFNPRTVGYVALDPTVAVKINKVGALKSSDLSANAPTVNSTLLTANTLGTNRLVIEGGYVSDYNSRKLNMAHAMIEAVDAGTDEAGYSQVNLQMYRYVGEGAANDDGTFSANHEAASTSNTLRNDEGKNYLTGFTPPFKQMAADYLFYHTYMKPNQWSLHSYEGTIADPFSLMEAGKGYFMSMEVSDESNTRIDARWADVGIKAENRARGGFEFNRRLMREYFNPGGVDNYGSSSGSTDYMEGFSRYAADNVLDAPTGTKNGNWAGGVAAAEGRDAIKYMPNEKFSIGDVTVSLVSGLNFLGNPFMAPISLNPLLGFTSDGTSIGDPTSTITPISVDTYFGSEVKASLSNFFTMKTLRSKYWVINNALINYSNTDNMFHMTVNYDFISTDGTTLTINDIEGGDNETGGNNRTITNPASFLIAPMQMFVLQANSDFDITLKPSLRTFGETRFLKSSNASLLSDFFVVEVESPLAKTTDRTAVVLRESSNLAKTDIYDTNKNLSESITLQSDKDRTYPEEGSSFIYTKSSDGTSMLGNGVPLNVKELALYVTPPATQQNMKLNFYNLENMLTVPNVWLIDRYENNKTVKLTPDYVYEFSSGPSDLTELSGENRFILRFYETDDDVVKEENPITCYYNTSVLHISGLNENDVNSDVYVYDMQGRLIGRTKVNNYPSMEYLKPLSLGTYVVKISGKRNFTSKFVNLQN